MKLPKRAGGAIAVAFNRAAKPGEAAGLLAAGADLFELRLDMAGNPDPETSAAMAASFAGHPLVVTCRRPDEGGQGDSDVNRLARLVACLDSAAAVDLELASAAIMPELAAAARGHGTDLVVSFHDMQGTPAVEQLQQTVSRALTDHATIAKVATTVREQADVDTLLNLLAWAKDGGLPLAVMGMGRDEIAATSRVELAKAGSLFVFAQAGMSSAPGQPSLDWLVDELRGTA